MEGGELEIDIGCLDCFGRSIFFVSLYSRQCRQRMTRCASFVLVRTSWMWMFQKPHKPLRPQRRTSISDGLTAL